MLLGTLILGWGSPLDVNYSEQHIDRMGEIFLKELVAMTSRPHSRLLALSLPVPMLCEWNSEIFQVRLKDGHGFFVFQRGSRGSGRGSCFRRSRSGPSRALQVPHGQRKKIILEARDGVDILRHAMWSESQWRGPLLLRVFRVVSPPLPFFEWRCTRSRSGCRLVHIACLVCV